MYYTSFGEGEGEVTEPDSRVYLICPIKQPSHTGLRIKETKEVYEGEVTELTPVETENPGGGYGKVRSLAVRIKQRICSVCCAVSGGQLRLWQGAPDACFLAHYLAAAGSGGPAASRQPRRRLRQGRCRLQFVCKLNC